MHRRCTATIACLAALVAAGCGDDAGVTTLDLGEHEYNLRPFVDGRLADDGLYIVYLAGSALTLIRGDRRGAGLEVIVPAMPFGDDLVLLPGRGRGVAVGVRGLPNTFIHTGETSFVLSPESFQLPGEQNFTVVDMAADPEAANVLVIDSAGNLRRQITGSVSNLAQVGTARIASVGTDRVAIARISPDQRELIVEVRRYADGEVMREHRTSVARPLPEQPALLANGDPETGFRVVLLEQDDEGGKVARVFRASPSGLELEGAIADLPMPRTTTVVGTTELVARDDGAVIRIAGDGQVGFLREEAYPVRCTTQYCTEADATVSLGDGSGLHLAIDSSPETGARLSVEPLATRPLAERGIAPGTVALRGLAFVSDTLQTQLPWSLRGWGTGIETVELGQEVPWGNESGRISVARRGGVLQRGLPYAITAAGGAHVVGGVAEVPAEASAATVVAWYPPDVAKPPVVWPEIVVPGQIRIELAGSGPAGLRVLDNTCASPPCAPECRNFVSGPGGAIVVPGASIVNLEVSVHTDFLCSGSSIVGGPLLLTTADLGTAWLGAFDITYGVWLQAGAP